MYEICSVGNNMKLHSRESKKKQHTWKYFIGNANVIECKTKTCYGRFANSLTNHKRLYSDSLPYWMHPI